MSEIHKKYLIASIILISMGIAMTSLMCADFSGRDLMQKYDVYQSGNYVVVEYKKDPKLFYFNERIYYSGFIKDAYLCTKEGKKAKCEEEAFLYVDLGVLGGWWADPFHNLGQDMKVSNECIPDGLVNEFVKHVHLNVGTPVAQLINEVERYRLGEDDIDRIAPEVVSEVYDEEAVGQWYYEVDFDNDNKMDIVAYNRLGLGDSGFTETYFYRQLSEGQYIRTYQLNSSGRATGFVRYEGKTYFMEICCALDNDAWEYDYDYCQLYYFHDGYPQETVRLTPENDQINIAVRKRFVNDFINISEGNR